MGWPLSKQTSSARWMRWESPGSRRCAVSAGADGIAVLWIEHVVRALLSTVDRLICLAGGVVVADGDPKEVLASEAVRFVYLGGKRIDEVAS